MSSTLGVRLGRLLRPAALLTVAAACAAALPQVAPKATAGSEAWRKNIPPSGPTPALHAPTPAQVRLKNDLTVLSVHQPQLPLCHVSLVLKSGSAQDPRGLPGLAAFTAELLKMGSGAHTAGQMATAIETLGTQIGVRVSEDAIVLHTTALSENVAAAFALLVEQVRRPHFAPQEIERLRKARLAELAQRDFEPGNSAQVVLRQALYGNHPYGHLPAGNAHSVARLGRAAIKHYYQEHFRPANAAVVVVGDLSEGQVKELVEVQLGDWRADPEAPAGPQLPVEAPLEHRAGVSLLARAGAPQSHVLVGELGAAHASRDFYALTLMNAILGGQFDSRINMNLREDKGYTYGARSSFDFMRQRGPFVIGAAVTSKHTGDALHEIFAEVDRMRSNDVSADELRAAKAHLGLSLPGLFQTVDGTAKLLAGLFLYDLPLSYFAELPAKLEAVEVADIRRVAQSHMRPEALQVVVVGDPDLVGPQLQQLGRGSVVRRDPQGRPQQPTAAKAPALLPKKLPK